MRWLAFVLVFSACEQQLRVGGVVESPDAGAFGDADASTEGDSGMASPADAGLPDGGDGGFDAGTPDAGHPLSDGGRALGGLGYGEWRVVASRHHVMDEVWVASAREAWAVSRTGRLLVFDGDDWLLTRPIDPAGLIAVDGTETALWLASERALYQWNGQGFTPQALPGAGAQPGALVARDSQVLVLVSTDAGTQVLQRAASGVWTQAFTGPAAALQPDGLLLGASGAWGWSRSQFEPLSAVAGLTVKTGISGGSAVWSITPTEVVLSTLTTVQRRWPRLNGLLPTLALVDEGLLVGDDAVSVIRPSGTVEQLAAPDDGGLHLVAGNGASAWSCRDAPGSPCSVRDGATWRARSFAFNSLGRAIGLDGGILIPAPDGYLVEARTTSVTIRSAPAGARSLFRSGVNLRAVTTEGRDGGGVWRLTGGSWVPERSERSTERLLDLWGSNDSNIWVVGERGQSSVVLFWNGVSWTQITNGRPARTLHAVWGRDVTSVWAVGVSTSGRGALLELSANSWSNANAPVVPELFAIAGDARVVWAGGRSGTLLKNVVPSTSWSLTQVPFSGDITALDVRPDGLWVAALESSGTTIWQHDGGTWRQSSTVPGGVQQFLDAEGSTWACGSDGTVLRRQP
jgi:hypothetical protein